MNKEYIKSRTVSGEVVALPFHKDYRTVCLRLVALPVISEI